MITIVFSVVVLIIASFLCALIEAAILSVPMLRVRMLVEEKRLNAKDLFYIKENITAAIATIVIINNTINIAGSMYIGHEITQELGNVSLGVATALLTFCIIIFGEIIPKGIGERFKVPVALIFAKPVRILLWGFRPIMWFAKVVTWPFMKGEKTRVSEEEIKMMLKIGRDSGTVELDEEILINRVFKLNDLRAGQIMKPMKDVYMIEQNMTIKDAKDLILASPYSRIVLYEGERNKIVGIVQHRILLREMAKDNDTVQLRELMLKPIFVNHMLKADGLMEKFQSFHQHLFIVQDNYGQNVGLVTMEDVLEELFGEIYDEKDVRFKMITRSKTT